MSRDLSSSASISSGDIAPDRISPSGMILAVGAYSIWGLTPIYWKAVAEVPATEILIPRVVWTLVLMWIVTGLVGRQGETWPSDARSWLAAFVAASALATNWGLFIFAVQSDQILATSLGYYVNPLVSVLLGLVILGERLNRAQAAAIAMAAAGVAIMAIRVGELPWISLSLAGSFALYGLVHKLAPQPPLAGLTREMLVLLPVALAALVGLTLRGESALLDAPPRMQLMLVLAGGLTAAPLLLFHGAARRLPLVAVGMFQYIAPTLALLLAIGVYGEAFTSSHGLGFGLVWLGLGVFSFDSIRRASGARAARRRMRNFPAATLTEHGNPRGSLATSTQVPDEE